MIIFETARLFLRQFTLADAGYLLQLNSDPDVLKFLHEPRLQDETQAKEILTQIILPQYERGLGRWATFKKDDNDFIGWCGLKYLPARKEIDIGYRFITRAWGFGYATEAAAKTIDHGFKSLDLNTIVGRAHIENFASLRVLEKIGMKYISEELIDDCPVKTFIAEKEK